LKLAAVLADLSRALESRDPFSRGHAARVTAFADAVARRLGWGDDRLAGLQIGGLLHDIGKLAVRERLLHKRGPLSLSERDEVRRHPTAGARLIEPIPSAHPALPYVLYHHERWDGAGYPFGTAGREIPEEARLLAVADAYDAMTSTRPYRAPLMTAGALAEIDRCAGTQFDPEMARAFLEVWGSSARAAS
jgi:HD-GYP domain-containing protein (c-di-GMP phosphodiesterase class II)